MVKAFQTPIALDTLGQETSNGMFLLSSKVIDGQMNFAAVDSSILKQSI